MVKRRGKEGWEVDHISALGKSLDEREFANGSSWQMGKNRHASIYAKYIETNGDFHLG